MGVGAEVDATRACGAAGTVRDRDASTRSSAPLELAGRRRADGAARRSFCENETNTARLFGVAAATPYPKDGINDHVVHGAATVNPAGTGTKAAFWYRARRSPPGATVELRLRLRPAGARDLGPGPTSTTVMAAREAEADEFYAELTPPRASDDEALRHAPGLRRDALEQAVLPLRRRALARRRPRPAAAARGAAARAATPSGGTFDALDVISMPDKWEYPWFAAWDLAFHCVALAHVDPAFAKDQLVLLCREWYMHPNGALAGLRVGVRRRQPAGARVGRAAGVRRSTARATVASWSASSTSCSLNFTWWVNRKDEDGD